MMIDLGLLREARIAYVSEDYDRALMLYREIACRYQDFSTEEKELLTEEVAYQAERDPRYREFIDLPNSTKEPPKVYFESEKAYEPAEFLLEIEDTNDSYALQRLATQYKHDGNWDLALACLFKSDVIRRKNKENIMNSDLLRLPLFLQQADRFEEAKRELQRIFEYLDENTKLLIHPSHHYKALLIKKFNAISAEYLFDKARLIYKRQGLIDKSDEFAELSKQYGAESELYSNKLDRFWEIECAASLETVVIKQKNTSQEYEGKQRVNSLLQKSKEENNAIIMDIIKTKKEKQINNNLAIMIIIGFVLIMLALITS